MRAHLGAFFQHDDVQIGIKLFEPDRGRQPAGPAPTITTSYSMT
jgi:hypothetical protein